MKIALAQLNPTIGNLSSNAEQILAAAEAAVSENARLMLTPELSLCGYSPRDMLMNPGFVQSVSTHLHRLAQLLPQSLAVLVGSVTENPHAASKGEKPLYNSIALLQGGAIQQIFHKRLLPTYDVFDDDRYFEPGRQSNSFSLDNDGSPFKIGVTICEDVWNEQEFWGKRTYEANPTEDLAGSEVELIVNLSGSPYSVGKQKLREAMLGHIASRYRQPIIYANQVGANDDLIYDGSSVAFNRVGEVVCRAKACQADLVVVEYSDEQDLLPASVEPLPDSEEAEIWAALVLGVKDYTRKCGFSKIVLGLSGGIDSSLVAAIAAAAVGPENVLGVLMPSPYSSQHSLDDAQALVNNLGIQSDKLPIGDVMQAYAATLEPLFEGTEFGVAEENIQSRIRGNLLMAIANKFNYLLVSTGNKSEMAVGYCTLYGDMSGGLAAIADVPKTRVFALCRWLNRYQEVIPANVITKPPSAELKPGQTDQDSLPPYDILDDILDRIITQHQSSAQIVAAGHERAVVDQVMKLLARAEFKRRQAPPGLKVTDRAFGTGWRMPIASRWSIPEETQADSQAQSP